MLHFRNFHHLYPFDKLSNESFQPDQKGLFVYKIRKIDRLRLQLTRQVLHTQYCYIRIWFQARTARVPFRLEVYGVHFYVLLACCGSKFVSDRVAFEYQVDQIDVLKDVQWLFWYIGIL